VTDSNVTHDMKGTAHEASETPNGWSGFGAAYDRRLAEIKALPDAELIPLNIDVHSAIATVLGTLPAISALKPRFARLVDVDHAQIAGLDEYAGAAAEANMRFETADAPSDEIVAMNDAAIKARETLRIDATALANRGLIDSNRLSGFKGLVGYKNVGFELLGWASVLHDSWAQIQNKTPVTEQELIAAKDLAERLIRAAGVREQSQAMVAEVAHVRQQAVTLMIKAYDQARRAVAFLRWNEGDAETIAPSLYAGRARKPNGAGGSDAATPASPAPATTASAAAPAAGSAPASPAPTRVAPGMPGASPFTAA
jgi:hypothetical protein